MPLETTKGSMTIHTSYAIESCVLVQDVPFPGISTTDELFWKLLVLGRILGIPDITNICIL